MNLDFEDRVVVLTGGGSGIGKATANAFVDSGAHVVVGDINIDAIEGRDRVTALQMDLLNDGEPKRLVDTALEKFDRVDIVVNCVGASIANEDFLDTTEESWHWHLELNLMVATRVTRFALPGMIERGKGAVVSVSSEAGRSPVPFFSEYSAAKAGLNAWSKCLSMVYGPKGIRLNTVAPGPIRTPGFMIVFERELAAAWGLPVEEAVAKFVEGEHMSIARLGEPEEVAAAILFLASDQASMITGLEIRVDGGGARFA